MGDLKLKILISAYACEPGKGSEIGVGWHWALEMSKYFELWVVTRANNQKPIEEYFRKHPEDNYGIHWVYFDLPDYIKCFKHQLRGVRTYYTLWQYGSNKLVEKIMINNGIEIFHLLTYGNAIWHISKYGQKKFFVWGPTGGVDTIAKEFSKHYSFKHRIVEAARRLVVTSLKFNPFFYKKCNNADLILCKAESTIRMIPKKYKNKAMIFTDVAMETVVKNMKVKNQLHSSKITYLTVGRLDGWRGFDLIIEAFPKVVEINPNLELRIIGEGAEKQHLITLIKALKMEKHISLVGEISREEYQNEMLNSDVVVNACLKEGGVTNAFDCMTWGKPLVCIDTGGYTRNFDKSCAIIIPRCNNRNKMICKLSEGMITTLDEKYRKNLSDGISKKGRTITWEEKGLHISDVITKSYNARLVK